MGARDDPRKNSAFEKVYYAVQEAIQAGCTAAELKEEVALSWVQVHEEEAKRGAEEIRKGGN